MFMFFIFLNKYKHKNNNAEKWNNAAKNTNKINLRFLLLQKKLKEQKSKVAAIACLSALKVKNRKFV